MRASGGPGLEGWMIVIPALALLVAMSNSAGGYEATLMALEGAVRGAVTAVIDFVGSLW